MGLWGLAAGCGGCRQTGPFESGKGCSGGGVEAEGGGGRGREEEYTGRHRVQLSRDGDYSALDTAFEGTGESEEKAVEGMEFQTRMADG